MPFYYRYRKVWWITMGVLCVMNFIAISANKFWHWRKEKMTISQSQNNPSQNNEPFNNTVYNSDVTSIKNLFFLFLTVALAGIIRAVSLTLIDKDESSQIAFQFFVNYKVISTFSLICAPLVLLISKKEARQHIKFLFWNEWAPDFVQAYNPNRVHGIGLTIKPSIVPVTVY